MLDFDFIEWDDVNVDHIANNGLSMDEVEDVIRDPRTRQDKSRSRRKDGRDVIIRPVTAYEVED